MSSPSTNVSEAGKEVVYIHSHFVSQQNLSESLKQDCGPGRFRVEMRHDVYILHLDPADVRKLHSVCTLS